MTKKVEFCYPIGSNIGAQPGYVWVYLAGEHYTSSFWTDAGVDKAVKAWTELGFEAELRKRR